jgi:hypothetical protein
MREIAERAHDDHRLRGAQAVEQRFELGSRSRVVVAVECDRAAADPLDQLERGFTLLVADGVAEQSPEQADVFLERQVLVGLVVQAAILAATLRGGGCTGFALEVTRFPGRTPGHSADTGHGRTVSVMQSYQRLTAWHGACLVPVATLERTP